MKDYNVNVNYNKGSLHPKTSPKRTTISTDRTRVVKTENKGRAITPNFRRAGTLGLAVSTKIASYVGELTENTVTARITTRELFLFLETFLNAKRTLNLLKFTE